ncbi:radical SAM domain containing protein [Trichomonas vaginalis G3]|uniref:Radical SAM domain containing protein n=1 Tax=Trichomonas vaginalis (strain ATCC PRA-98 / G3) TaxID=412133 RepID=A2FIM6_TRIV3|nr:anaerobic sulfatase-maturating enzyme-like protein, ALSB-related family [Trichomonas vaginalis G3]EAX95236.1 radical SAM domain containing protein [Trichomonas vaginalis G3]KAI5503488.1 anaerobic sulfatase-maturating enzyme-like protein, ALSB-related family [Trichomonas vaginalis G3]|eukprot:XP_001308166.1 radical SAM domain containing protein [Trichomonas vaginalis G3]
MLWFVTLTQECNLTCKYCGSDENEDIEDIMAIPRNIVYDIKNLEKLRKDPDLALCFYGGEPLLRIDRILEIMKLLPDAKFVLQTNATLLHKLPTENLLKLDTILVSVDGDSHRTNSNRGKGTWERSISNARDARDRGFKGDMIARMTVGPGSHIFEDVMYLLTLQHGDKPLFDHVHWQLNVEWDTPPYAAYENFEPGMNFFRWRDERYNPGVTKLIDAYIEGLKEGRQLGIVPIQGILWSYLTGEKYETVRCSSGWESFNVTTSGDITACPIATEYKSLGDITKIDTPFQLAHIEKVGAPCDTCEVLSECGGRCLYCNQTQWWNEEGLLEVCVTIKHLLKEIKTRIVPLAWEKINSGQMKVEDFHYPPYNNSTEIIP